MEVVSETESFAIDELDAFVEGAIALDRHIADVMVGPSPGWIIGVDKRVRITGCPVVSELVSTASE